MEIESIKVFIRGGGSLHKATIDSCHEELYKTHRWYVDGRGYMAARIDGKVQFFHRLIFQVEEPSQVDHINGIKTDNRLCNLRKCTKQMNQANREKSDKPSTSIYKGVYFEKWSKKFRASICVNYRTINLGRFKTQEEAALAYNEAAARHFGEYAKLNRVQAEAI